MAHAHRSEELVRLEVRGMYCCASPTSFSCQHFGVTYYLDRASLSIYFMLCIGKSSGTLQIPTMNLMTKMLLYVCSLLEGLPWYFRHVRFYIEEIALGHVYRLFYQAYNLCYFHYFHKGWLTQAHEHLYGTWFCSHQARPLHLDRGHRGGLPWSARVSRLVRGSSGVAFHSCFIHLLITFRQILWGWNLLSGAGPCMPKGKFFWRVSIRAIKPFLSQWKKFFTWIGWLQFTSNSKCNPVTQEMFSLCLFLSHSHMHTLTPNTHSHTTCLHTLTHTSIHSTHTLTHIPLTHPAHTHTKYTLTPHSCTLRSSFNT